MHLPRPLLCAALLVTTLVTAPAEDRHYLYLSSPDAAQNDGHSGTGVLVFDIDAGHRFVRRIDIPMFREGLRGFTGNTKNHCIYYSTTNHGLGCFDLETEKVLWEKHYALGCDRSSITPDGTKLYVPTGWWYRDPDGGFLVINPTTGDLVKQMPVGGQAHNSITSLDGQFVFLGTETILTVFRTTDDSVVRQVKPVGESGVFPYTVDSQNRHAFVCLGKHVGFDVVDLQNGTVPHRVLAGDTPIPHRTHGAALTPDETELWISDQEGKKLFIFDATQMPPSPKEQVELSTGGHGWVSFSMDGRFAWTHTPDVFDARTKRQIAVLKDEKEQPVSSSKFIEVTFRNDKVVAVGNEFGLGRAHQGQPSVAGN
ncbi:YncE family protein [Verrucomicrobiota bacterium sgz303538]